MKYMVTAIPGPMPPSADQLRAAKDWLESKEADGTFDCLYGFLEGGGFSVSNADSHGDVIDMMMDYPLFGLVQWEVRPLTTLDEGLPKAIAKLEEMAAAA